MNRHSTFPGMLARRAELTAQDEARLQNHLATCPDCRSTASAYAQQTALLRALPILEPPPALRAGVLNRLHEQPQPKRGFWPFSGALLLAPVAALLLVVAGVVYVNRPQGTNHTAAVHSSTPTATFVRQTPGALQSSPKPLPGTPKNHPSRFGRPRPGSGAHPTRTSTSTGPGRTVNPPLVAQAPSTTSVPSSSSSGSLPAPGPAVAVRPIQPSQSSTHHPAISAPSQSQGPSASGAGSGPGTGGAPHPPSTGGGRVPTSPVQPPAVAAPQPTVAVPPPPPVTAIPPPAPVGAAGIRPTPVPGSSGSVPAQPPVIPTPQPAYAPIAPAPLPTPTP